MMISGTSLIVAILIAAVCGTIGKALVGGVHGGLLTSIPLGFIGALLGPWVAHAIGLSEPLMIHVDGKSFPILWSIIGAALLVAFLHLLTPRRRWLRI